MSGTTVLNLTHSLTVGNVTLSGSAELVFGNSSWSATLTILGDLYVTGSAEVRWWDAYVVIVGGYTAERSVSFYGSSRLTLDDALVSSDDVSWDGEFYDAANVTVLSSSVAWHSVLQFHDNTSLYCVNSQLYADLQPSQDARLVQFDSAGSTLWFPFGNRTVGNFSFPVPDVETNWTFPPSGASGLGYKVRVRDDWPSLYAPILYPGSNVTFRNSSDLDVALLPIDGRLSGSGFRFGANPNFTWDTPEFGLRLINDSVDAWSFYPLNSSLTLTDSQVGEVNGWSGSVIRLTDSNLTDAGGYYAVFENSSLTISNSTIGSTVLGYDESQIALENSSVGPGEPVEAVDNASIVATNVTLGAGAAYSVDGNGRVDLREVLDVAVARSGSPVGGANVSVRSAQGGSVWNATTDPGGSAWFYPPVEEITEASDESNDFYLLTASAGNFAAENATELVGPSVWRAELVPWIAGVAPAKGNLSAGSLEPIRLTFGLPMNRTSVERAISLVPSTSANLSWASNDSQLTISPGVPWSAGEELRVLFSGPVRSIDGLVGPTLPYLTFQGTANGTEPPPVEVVGSVPAGGDADVPLLAPLVLEFSVPMDPSTTGGAFRSSPTLPDGLLDVNGSLLEYVPYTPLRPGTMYTLSVTSGATARDGRALDPGWNVSFTTVGRSSLPTILSTDPANGSTPVEVAAVAIYWSVPMDPNSTAAAWAIDPEVAGAVVMSVNLETWHPAGALLPNTTYTVTVGYGARSASGEPVLSPEWITFTTPSTPAAPVGARAAAPPDSGPIPWTVVAVGGLVALGALAAGVWLGRRPRPPVR